MASARRQPRRWLLAVLLALTALAAGCGGGSDEKASPVQASVGGEDSGGAQRFASAPSLHPASVEITRPASEVAPGLVFAAPRPEGDAQGGPMIFGNDGKLVWFRALEKGEQAIDFKVQEYEGKPVITWGQRPVDTHAGAFWTLLNSAYGTVATVHAGQGDGTDLHDFLITPRNTALLIGYHVEPRDLSSIGGDADGKVLDGTLQEVDIATGKVLWRWSALDHVPVDESTAKVPHGQPYDAYHVNSVDEDADGNILVSMRHTSTLYKVDRKTGAILWRLGGKRSDFDVAPDAAFHFQHDAQWHGPDTITVFDNGTTNHTKVEPESSGKRIHVDLKAHKVTLDQAYTSPDPLSSSSQGTYQTLSDGHALLGWGKQPVVSEFAADGDLIFEARFPTIDQQSYSAHRAEWTGRPTTKPAAILDGRGDDVELRVSWNGATQVRSWRVVGGQTPGKLTAIGDAPGRGFETVLRLKTSRPVLAVQALDRSGHVLGTSKPLTEK
jgi:hypothetical protein